MWGKQELAICRSEYRPTPLEPSTYYHSTGSLNPMKLIGILHHGILSKSTAEEKGLLIDANGLQCNGTNYVSVATTLGGCVSTNMGAFHLAIEREKLTSNIRKNPEQDMPLERQVKWIIPRDTIKAIYLEKAGVLDIDHPHTTLGIGIHNIERARVQVQSYMDFMATEFEHHLPTEDQSSIKEILSKMENTKYLNYSEKVELCEPYEQSINIILKKHLKLCYQTVIPKESITPYDIIRYYDQNIPVYDFEGNEILSLSAESTKLSTIDEIGSDRGEELNFFKPGLVRNESPLLKRDLRSTAVPQKSKSQYPTSIYNFMNRTRVIFSESSSNEKKQAQLNRAFLT